MKRFYVLVASVLVLVGNTSCLYSQWQSKLAPGIPGKHHYTLNDLSKAFNEYWAPYHVQNGYYRDDGILKKAYGWEEFKRAEWYWQQRVNPRTGEFPTTTTAAELQKSRVALRKASKTASSASWVNLGTNSSSGGYAGIGRINCIAFHPTDPNTYWVGTPAGGIWKTTNNGSSWSVLNDGMPVIGVSDIAIPSNYATSNTLYIATGDRDIGGGLSTIGAGRYPDNNSIGVYKSTDGGATWSATGFTLAASSNSTIGRLLIASDNTTLYVSHSLGIDKSTDGGNTWSRVLTDSYVIDMEFKPGDNNTIYASTYAYGAANIYRSTDAGASWSTVFTGAGDDYRIELAVTANDPTYVYAIVAYYNNISGAVPLRGIYKSTDSGGSFALVFNGTTSGHNLLGYTYNGSDMFNGQGEYTLSMAVSPTDKNTVMVGGVNTWYSTDGGTSWTVQTMWAGDPTDNPTNVQVVHADKHCLAFQSGTVLFDCNDGGIYRAQLANASWSDPGSNFVDKTNGLVISQIYRIGVSKTDGTKVLNGLQDNGSKLYNNGVWTDVTGGDGTECIIDNTNPLYMYASYVQGVIYRNTNGFTTTATTTISANIPGGQPVGSWVTPYIMDPVSSLTIYAGYDRIWKTTDRGNTWAQISGALSPSPELLRVLAIAPSNPDVMYAADRTHIWKTTNATAAVPTWTDITWPTYIATISYIAVKVDDPSTLWVTLGEYNSGNKVYESTNGGTTWTNISGSLPNIPILCVAQYTRTPGTVQLFVGTDAGVYAKEGTADWFAYSEGLPNVVVTELEFFYGTTALGDRLRAATYGRGLWETPLGLPLPVELTAFSAVAGKNTVQLNWSTATESNNYGFEIERSTGADQWEKIGFEPGHGYSNAPHLYSFTDQPRGGLNFFYRLKQKDADGRFKYSDVVEATLGAPSQFIVHQNFPNPFNPVTTIRYELPTAGRVTITLMDNIGREIKTLLAEDVSAGYHEFAFDGSQLASGIYYCSVQMGEAKQIKRMVLIK